MKLENVARFLMQACRENDAGGTEQSQIMALAEEAGEFVGAMRRWRGMARRHGTEQEAQDELADVVLCAYAMADVMGWDMDTLLAAKLDKILNRGWKEPVKS